MLPALLADRGIVVAFNGPPTFLTVFVDAALFSDDRELRKLVRELLRSTSRLLSEIAAAAPLPADWPTLDCESVFRSEFVRFGSIVRWTEVAVAGTRNDRLRSKLCRFRSNKL